MMSRARIAIAHALIAGALAAAASAASAQTYPSQPVKMIVPFTAGSPNDVVARILAQQLTIRLGQNVIIDNRPGAGTNAGTKAAASAEPNGYTLLFNSSSMVVSPAMYRNPGYDPENSFVPVANAVFGHWVTVIEKSIPANTVPEFIAYAKKNPGKLRVRLRAGRRRRSSVGEWLKVREGIDITSVPYKGGAQAIIDMIGERIHLNIGTTATIVPHIKDRQRQGDFGVGPAALSGPAGRADHDRKRLSWPRARISGPGCGRRPARPMRS